MTEPSAPDRLIGSLLQLQSQRLTAINERTKSTADEVGEIREQIRHLSKMLSIIEKRTSDRERN